MLRTALLLAAVGYVLGAAIPDGLLPHSNGRIVGGGTATIEAFPWQVSVQRSGSHGCGATIYTNKIIITAAHCISTATAPQLRIRAGSTNWSSGGEVVAVVAFLKHEKYVASTSANDIAVMRLESSLTFSSTIRPIALASAEPPNGAAAVVTGWGVTKYNSFDIPAALHYANVRMISTDACASEAYDYGSIIELNMICAAAAGKDACQDDSGGPLVSGGVLVGVVSWGEGCALPNYPGVYVNVAVLKPWIEKAAGTL